MFRLLLKGAIASFALLFALKVAAQQTFTFVGLEGYRNICFS